MHPRWDAGCPTPQLQTPGTTYCCLLMPHWSTCSAAKNRPEQMGDGGDASTLGFRPPDTTVADAWDCILLSANATLDPMLGIEITQTGAWESQSGRRWHGCQRPSVCSPTRVQGNRDGWASGWTAGWWVARPPELLNHLLYH